MKTTRRGFLAAAAAAGVGALVTGVRLRGARAQGTTARLRARPAAPTVRSEPGRHPLPAEAGDGAWLHVPALAAGQAAAVPLLVMLHGASRTFPPMDRLVAEADGRGFAVAVPIAGEHTWDLMASSGYGEDVLRLDAALEAAFNRVDVDTGRVCLAGFSDGASYALSVGLQNGDLFTHLMAFSPGFIGPGRPVGAPRVFISHGLRDRILPIERTTARILRSLELRSLDVAYREFDGGHGVPDEVQRQALDWLLA